TRETRAVSGRIGPTVPGAWPFLFSTPLGGASHHPSRQRRPANVARSHRGDAAAIPAVGRQLVAGNDLVGVERPALKGDAGQRVNNAGGAAVSLAVDLLELLKPIRGALGIGQRLGRGPFRLQLGEPLTNG